MVDEKGQEYVEGEDIEDLAGSVGEAGFEIEGEADTG